MSAKLLALIAAFVALFAVASLPAADAEGEEETAEESGIDWVPIAVIVIGAVAAVIGYRYHPAIVAAGAIVAVFGAAWALGWIDPAGWIDSLTQKEAAA